MTMRAESSSTSCIWTHARAQESPHFKRESLSVRHADTAARSINSGLTGGKKRNGEGKAVLFLSKMARTFANSGFVAKTSVNCFLFFRQLFVLIPTLPLKLQVKKGFGMVRCFLFLVCKRKSYCQFHCLSPRFEKQLLGESFLWEQYIFPFFGRTSFVSIKNVFSLLRQTYPLFMEVKQFSTFCFLARFSLTKNIFFARKVVVLV